MLVQLRLVEHMILHADLTRLTTARVLDGVHLSSLARVHHPRGRHLVVLWSVQVLLGRGLTSGCEGLVPWSTWRLLMLTRLGIRGWLTRQTLVGVAWVGLAGVGEGVGHDAADSDVNLVQHWGAESRKWRPHSPGE